MPVNMTPISEWASRQQERGTRASRQCLAYMAETGPRLADVWERNAVMMLPAVPGWVETLQQRKPVTAAMAALGTNTVLLAACYTFPALAVPNLSLQIGMTVGAATFGWFVIDHRFAALGAVIGAAVGAGIAALCGLSLLPLTIAVVALAACAGGALAASVPFVGDTAPANVPTRDDEASAARPSRLRVRTGLTSASAYSGDVSISRREADPASAAWRQQLRQKLDRLDHPYAALYRAKGLRQLAVCESPQTAEDRLGTLSWLTKFDRLVDTLAPVQAASPEALLEFDTDLERRFESIWGNVEVKSEIRQRVALQRDGAGAMGVVCIGGTSGSGKNRICNAVKDAYGISQEIELHRTSLEAFTGFAKTFVDAEPSRIAELLIESPASFCVVHIDEIEKASQQNQQALLSLLAPENQFGDGYFGLPLNKSRLLVLCTLHGDQKGLANVEPDLWNRLKQHLVYTTKVTPAGCLALAERVLETRLLAAHFAAMDPAQRRAAASEVCLARPDGEPARYIEESVSKVLLRAVLMRRRAGVAPAITPSLVSCVLNRTWATRQTLELVTPQTRVSPLRTNHYDLLTLFALVRHDATRCRWHIEVGDGRAVTVDLDERSGLMMSVMRPDGTPDTNAFYIDMALLPYVTLEPNEIFSPELLDEQMPWPRPGRLTTAQYATTLAKPLSSYRTWARPMDEQQSLLALPVVLHRHAD